MPASQRFSCASGLVGYGGSRRLARMIACCKRSNPGRFGRGSTNGAPFNCRQQYVSKLSAQVFQLPCWSVRDPHLLTLSPTARPSPFGKRLHLAIFACFKRKDRIEQNNHHFAANFDGSKDHRFHAQAFPAFPELFAFLRITAYQKSASGRAPRRCDRDIARGVSPLRGQSASDLRPLIWLIKFEFAGVRAPDDGT